MIERDIHGWKCTPEDFEKSVKWFTLDELTRSNYFDAACEAGINPMPDGYAIERLRQLCMYVLDPLRERWGAPILINSGYRCEWINVKVGGVKNSQHTKGEAADIRCQSKKDRDIRYGNRRLLGLILFSDLCFDQVIAENCDENGYPEWIHISLKPNDGNRNQFLVKKRPTPAPSPARPEGTLDSSRREGRGEKKQIQ